MIIEGKAHKATANIAQFCIRFDEINQSFH